jgi:hypothetical protein
MNFLQTPYALLAAILLVVSAIRQLTRRADGTQRIDGPWRVCGLAAACGAVLAGLQAALPWIVAFIAAHPVVGVVIAGALAGFGAFGGHDLLAGLLRQVAPLSIDARGGAGSMSAGKSTFEIAVTADTGQAEAALDDLKAKAEATTAAVLASTVIVPPPKVPT